MAISTTIAALLIKMEQEIWKSIKTYEGLYEVSNLGRIKSLSKRWSVGIKKETVLRPSISKAGYLRVVLCHNSIKKHITIHKLVATHFCTNDNGNKIINHKNGIKSDNRADNLEWCTYSENALHAFSQGLVKPQKGERNGNTKIKEQDVSKIKRLYKEERLSQIKIGLIFGISQTQVGRIVNNKRWVHL